jgi:hypothetical protein
MSIPDEVAQYAEGKRIAAYFDFGLVKDEVKGINHDWLWAISSDVEGFDFDSIRVFTWNRRRHRYETAYREHGIEGYLPIRVEASDSKYLFDVIVRAADGQFLLRRYQFDGTLVHLLSKDPYQQPSGLAPGKRSPCRSWNCRRVSRGRAGGKGDGTQSNGCSHGRVSDSRKARTPAVRLS